MFSIQIHKIGCQFAISIQLFMKKEIWYKPLFSWIGDRQSPEHKIFKNAVLIICQNILFYTYAEGRKL